MVKICNLKCLIFKLILFVSVVSFLNFHIRSEGCDDPGKTAATCGIAYIIVNGKDYSPHSRGHNVVIVDAKTGKTDIALKCTSKIITSHFSSSLRSMAF